MTSTSMLPTVPATADATRSQRLTPEMLIFGPCALPSAPMAMPSQQIEPDLRLSTRLARLLGRRTIGESS